MNVKNIPQEGAGGARFFRCALQVNPYAYIARHGKKSRFPDEASYNTALIDACIASAVEVIAVTDHYRIRSSVSLIATAQAAGLVVFPGFEAVSKDGVHFLCLFSPDTPVHDVDRRIGECGIAGDAEDSPVGTQDALELMACCERWGAICIAAHVGASGGLLKKLSGKSAINAWRSQHLLACSLPGPIKDAQANIRPILENKNADYHRERPVAVVNAQDVSDPADLARPASGCAIKMSKPSCEALRLAFLDPQSRIRLDSDAKPKPHTELLNIEWEGGFLDGTSLQLNESLNILIGGRGTGKSTVVESIRYVLDSEPIGEQARRSHTALVKNVLRSGTRIAMRLRSPHPSPREYLIERTVPNRPAVKDADGDLLDLTPDDVTPNLDVFSQHELSELARDPEQRTRLLDRFLEQSSEQEDSAAHTLQQSGKKVLAELHRAQKLEQRISQLPATKETLQRYEDAGLEDRLQEKTQLVREQHLFDQATDRIAVLAEHATTLEANLPVDSELLDAEERDALPNGGLVARAEQALAKLSTDAGKAAAALRRAIEKSEAEMSRIDALWEAASEASNADYERALRKLQREDIDGAEFIRLRGRIETLESDQKELTKVKAALRRARQERGAARLAFEEHKAKQFRALAQAAKKVTRSLRGRVQVKVHFQGNREPLIELLRERVGGRLQETCEALTNLDQLSLSALADACRTGPEVLVRDFGIPASQAPRLAAMDEEALMAIEELTLPATTALTLNVAVPGAPESWRALEDLSAGQKATAVLLLLLLESDAPLIIDQPEDDLDNRFITDGVVPQVRKEKHHRQFVFATHNANIAVLGDAELIVALNAHGDGGHVQASIPSDHVGSLDLQPVREVVEEVLEGGKAAFELRRLKYGF